MALVREDVNFGNIKREADIELLVNYMVQTNNMIAHLKDEQFEMRNEIKRRDETISKLQDDIRLLKKEKRWNMLWQNSLEEDINHTQIAVLASGVINVLFTYFMSR
ncbi:hypothetical protein J3330_03220 [Leuconostoc mesenteroides]|uniref:hypothetical protein n=1 Tax=Leuconostoc mesenteroides TaxID=1245 RepID=UPI001CBD8AFF|nr:hypothetical protein [Leuconostoc mesenteroides]MBZ1518158.1 hypothetical protein [Leuconostoc mesenteroides]MBZ1521069.1 hypothetical protein [Leuconostoc mesenteroides]MBZ1522955.1 hypothetical protein [Leuconostoc mesenteroides]